MELNKTKRKSSSVGLIILCWMVYTCSYLGKLSYTANINGIGAYHGVSYAEAGLVSTFFFFTYGIGQIFNGIFSKRYNIRLTVFISLAVSGCMNILVAVVPSFGIIKYIWLINGAAVSFLWTALIRLLSETLSEDDMPRATIAMGTTVATGTFIIYGLSSLFSLGPGFKAAFICAACIVLAVGAAWLLFYDRLVRASRDDGVTVPKRNEDKKKSSGATAGVMGVLSMLAVFAVADNLVKDGLTAWTPDILASLYSTPPWLSILLTLFLPLVAIFGVSVATRIQSKTNSFVGTCTLLFGGASVLITAGILLLRVDLVPVTVGCFAAIACLMSGVNNVITSMMPLKMRDRINSGKAAGIMNGFCYLGSTVSAYGLGLIADRWGWSAVFITLLSVCVGVFVAGAVYISVKKLYRTYKSI